MIIINIVDFLRGLLYYSVLWIIHFCLRSLDMK